MGDFVTIKAIDLAEILRNVATRAEAPMPALSDEACIASLRSHLEAWDKPCPFRRGDIVRPARHSSSWKPTLGLCIVKSVLAETLRRVDESSRAIRDWDMTLLVLNASGDSSAIEIEGHSRDFELMQGAANADRAEGAPAKPQRKGKKR